MKKIYFPFQVDSFISPVLFIISLFLLLQAQCGGYFNASRYRFASPDYPQKYGDNRNCSWQIVASQYHIIELRFQTFDIENGYDSVEVFDGEISSSKSLGKYSGDCNPGVLYSNGNAMSLSLHSDELYSEEGFLAYYRTSKLKFLFSRG